jgi:hypothetical protein
MNHNFLPFEICEMLPKENPFLKQNHKHYCFVKSSAGNPVLKWDFRLSSSRKTGEYLRDAWTIIDAITWLEKQNFFVEVNCTITENIHWLYRIRFDNDNKRIFLGGFKTRFEAYFKGIERCLELIYNYN